MGAVLHGRTDVCCVPALTRIAALSVVLRLSVCLSVLHTIRADARYFLPPSVRVSVTADSRKSRRSSFPHRPAVFLALATVYGLQSETSQEHRVGL